MLIFFPHSYAIILPKIGKICQYINFSCGWYFLNARFFLYEYAIFSVKNSTIHDLLSKYEHWRTRKEEANSHFFFIEAYLARGMIFLSFLTKCMFSCKFGAIKCHFHEIMRNLTFIITAKYFAVYEDEFGTLFGPFWWF